MARLTNSIKNMKEFLFSTDLIKTVLLLGKFKFENLFEELN